jgi:hypothetical protein
MKQQYNNGQTAPFLTPVLDPQFEPQTHTEKQKQAYLAFGQAVRNFEKKNSPKRTKKTEAAKASPPPPGPDATESAKAVQDRMKQLETSNGATDGINLQDFVVNRNCPCCGQKGRHLDI